MGLKRGLNDQTGAITPLCMGLFIVLALAGFGIWGLLRTWRLNVESQFRLDHQVAREALSIKRSISLAEGSNQRMQVIRASTVGAALTPYTLAAVRAELEVEKFFQEGIRLQWEAEQFLWKMKIASWQRLPDDAIGAQPFTWSDRTFRLEARSGARAAAAEISGDLNVETEMQEWHAQWTNFY